MSEMEYHKGTLKKRFKDKVSFEDGIKILKEEYKIKDFDIEIEDKYVYSDKVHFINEEFYVVDNHMQYDPDNTLIKSVNEDGSIEFMLSFYNGGASLSDVLEKIINK